MKHYKDYYKILNITKNATNNQIRESYYKLALEFHPDKLKNKTEDNLYFIEVSQAYEILRNKQKRSAYDQNYQNPTVFLFKIFMEKDLSLFDFKEYVEAGADIEATNKMGQSIIMIAANRGNLEIVRYLLSKGISPNSHDYLKINLLMFATMPSLYKFNSPEVEEKNAPTSEEEKIQQDNEFDKIKEELAKITPPEENKKEKENINNSSQKESDKNDDSQKNKDFIINKAKVIELLLQKGGDPMASNIFNGNALGIAIDDKIKEFIDVYYNFLVEQEKQVKNFLGDINHDSSNN